jgi:hypothetical protein
MASVSTPFRDANGTEIATLTITNVGTKRDRLELDGEQIVVEEEASYVATIDPKPGLGRLRVNAASELFSFDNPRNRHGRLTPKRHVGQIRVALSGTSETGIVTLSVQPRKLVDDEYHHMLRDIASVATEAILQGFAPSAVALTSDGATEAKLLYQQFAFLHSRLVTSGEDDLALILNRPHTAWVEQEELRPAGTPLRGTSRNVRSLSRSGSRALAAAGAGRVSVPNPMRVTRTNETLDTEANRFVVFALQHWRALAARVVDHLEDDKLTGPVSRGLDAANEVLALLDRTLKADLFREVGRLHGFPSANQVLQKRAGYREIFRTFVLVEAGARIPLDWDIDDIFSASVRDVAKLYEYWTFIKLAQAVGQVCGQTEPQLLMAPTERHLSLGFKSPLSWSTTVRGRVINARLSFNHEFAASADGDASWTERMRPDCSLFLEPEGADAATLGIWLHFDAKYAVGRRSRRTEAKSEHVAKMHAYRDAIRRSAGAYVMYPGSDDNKRYSQHREVLPGLGAFVLRPSSQGEDGTKGLAKFLHDVLDHLADRATQHERGRYWSAQVYGASATPQQRGRKLPALTLPPSDAYVTLGYVWGAPQEEWINDTKLYNVRAGDRRGAVGVDADVLRPSELVLYQRASSGVAPSLWIRTGPWFVQTDDDLVREGYPGPRGRYYLCAPIEPHPDPPDWISSLPCGTGVLEPWRFGAPMVASWSDLLEAAG